MGESEHDRQLADDLLTALRTVIDPELGLDIVALGLVYHASIHEGEARIVYTLTSPACPLGSLIEAEIEIAVSEVDGVDSVQSRLVFDPAWTPERMTLEAQDVLGYTRAPRR